LLFDNGKERSGLCGGIANSVAQKRTQQQHHAGSEKQGVGIASQQEEQTVVETAQFEQPQQTGRWRQRQQKGASIVIVTFPTGCCKN